MNAAGMPTSRVRPKEIVIDVINQATSVLDIEGSKVVRALQKQVDLDWFPAWGFGAVLHYVKKGAKPDPAHWWLLIADNADQAGALGYHELSDTRLPLGKVFVETTKRYGGAWSCTASHELLEMLADPRINVLVFMEAGFARAGDAHLVGYEVCDPCEDDSQGYDVDGVRVSDFVLPAYFEADATAGPFDFRKLITRPFQILPNGYLGVLPIGRPGGWTQINGRVEADPSAPLARGIGRTVPATVDLDPDGYIPSGGPVSFATRPHDGSRRRKRMDAWAGYEWAPSVALSK